ncbi:hypothetical protein ACQ4WX_47445 [Streptomyces lasalocidi]|uniref:hypothetical protein n=1 Tax=Streptomyces sp. MUSC 14 TaxID=1354889 RepID=UPI0015A71E48|nr:hypothetical protein [Streptomyces sp. MUSC 14]
MTAPARITAPARRHDEEHAAQAVQAMDRRAGTVVRERVHGGGQLAAGGRRVPAR